MIFQQSLLVVASLIVSRAMAESEPWFCSQANDCGDCVMNGCSWAADQCIESCSQIADTKCYNQEIFQYMSSQEICHQMETEKMDGELCALQEGCFSCTSAVKSDGSNCQYYIDEHTKMGYCGSGGCDMMGNCPLESCPTSNNGASIPVPLPVDYNCQARSSCASCLADGSTCAWIADSCQDACTDVADAACYTLDSFPNQNGDEICAAAEAKTADDDLCALQEGCFTCTAAVKSDGSNCQYYIDEYTKMGYCGSGGCDMMGNCPLESCPTSNNGVSIPVPFPVDYNCQARSSCASCLAGGSTCAWIADSCQDSCTDVADAACYTLDSFPNQNGDEICAAAEAAKNDDEICAQQEECFSCTSTLKSDWSKCKWYMDETTMTGYCGSGGCDMMGNCPLETCPTDSGIEEIPVPLPVNHRGNFRGSN